MGWGERGEARHNRYISGHLEAGQECDLSCVVGIAGESVDGTVQMVDAAPDGHPRKAAHWQKPNVMAELQVADLHCHMSYPRDTAAQSRDTAVQSQFSGIM